MAKIRRKVEIWKKLYEKQKIHNYFFKNYCKSAGIHVLYNVV